MGVITASFRTSGTDPDAMDKFTILVKAGSSASKLFFNSHVGSGPRTQDLVGDFIIILLISSVETGLKDERWCAMGLRSA